MRAIMESIILLPKSRKIQRFAIYVGFAGALLVAGVQLIGHDSSILRVAGAFSLTIFAQLVLWLIGIRSHLLGTSVTEYEDNKYTNGDLSARKKTPKPSIYSDEYPWEDGAELFARLVKAASGNHSPQYVHSELTSLCKEVQPSTTETINVDLEVVIIRVFAIVEETVQSSLANRDTQISHTATHRNKSPRGIIAELKNQGERIPVEAIEAFELLWEMRNRAAHENGNPPSRKTVMKILDYAMELEGLLAGRPV